MPESVIAAEWRIRRRGSEQFLLSPFAIAFYVIGVLAITTFWFWQDL